jgi:hypothetical protein
MLTSQSTAHQNPLHVKTKLLWSQNQSIQPNNTVMRIASSMHSPTTRTLLQTNTQLLPSGIRCHQPPEHINMFQAGSLAAAKKVPNQDRTGINECSAASNTSPL